MTRTATLLALMLMSAASAAAQRQMPYEGIYVRLTGNAYLAGAIWPTIGAPEDPRPGAGVGGMLGAALVIDEMRYGFGPHVGFNMWTADYSAKPSTTTKSLTFSTVDTGVELGITFRHVVGIFGLGTSMMRAYSTLDDGSEVRIAGQDREHSGYGTLGVGFTNERFVLGAVYTSYGGFPDANRLEVRLAVGH